MSHEDRIFANNLPGKKIAPLFWDNAKQSGIHYLTRCRSNLRLDLLGNNRWDREAPLDPEVLSDEIVSGGQVVIRKVIYQATNMSWVVNPSPR